jgi:N6-adenosine-specific RNA methylase IME4
MTVEAICELNVSAIAQENSVLFLWATSPMLENALTVMKAWGFRYKTSFVWDKVKPHDGYYSAVRHELLLLGTKGACLPDARELYDSLITIRRAHRHSEKPGFFRTMIDMLYPTGRRIELFARKQPSGRWNAWGDQVPILDVCGSGA